MVDVSLFGLFADAVDSLTIADRSQCADGQRLGLASLEHAGTVRSGEHAGVAPDRTNFLRCTVVRTDVVVEDQASDLFLGDVVQNSIDVARILREDLFEVFLGLRFDSVHVLKTGEFFLGQDSFAHLVGRVFADRVVDVFRNLVQIDFLLGFADFCNDLVDESNDLLDFLMTEEDRVEDDVFRHFLCTGFDHHDSVLGTCHVQGQVALGSLLAVRVDDEFAVDSADEDSTGRAIPRDVGDRDRAGAADHRSDLARCVMIHAHDGRDDLHVIVVPLREQRTQRAVHQTGEQDRLLTRTSLSLEESAGDAADCVHLLFIVAGQREEIDVRARLLGSDDGDVDHCLAVTDPYLTVGLLADLADLQLEELAAYCGAKCLVIFKLHFNNYLLLKSFSYVPAHPAVYMKSEAVHASLYHQSYFLRPSLAMRVLYLSRSFSFR